MSLNKNEIIKHLKAFLMESRNAASKFWVAGKVREMMVGSRVVGEIEYISMYVDKSTFELFSNEINHTPNLSGNEVLWLDVNDYPIKLFCEIPNLTVIGKKSKTGLAIHHSDDIESLFRKNYYSAPIV